MEDRILFPDNESSVTVIQMNPVNIVKMAQQLSANILDQISYYPIEENKLPTEGAGSILSDRFDWAPHGFVNAMISQVNFVFMVAQHIADGPSDRIIASLGLDARETIQIITNALQDFQDWKERVCQRKCEVHGENFGSATEFNNKNWVEHNKKLLSLIHH